jgi:hypothetical protein
MSATTIHTLTRFWLALERIPGQAAVAAQWRHLLGSDFEIASRWMTPESRLAQAYPRFDPPGFDYTVIEHGPDDFVGVCEDDGERTTLARNDLVVYRVDLKRLMSAIAVAFGFAAEGTDVPDVPFTHRVGTYRPHAGVAIPVYLTIRLEHTEYKSVLNALIAATRSSFVLLAPTNRHHRIACQLLFDAHRCLFLALADAILADSLRLGVSGDARSALADFAAKIAPAIEEPVAEEPLGERAQDVLVAMREMGATDCDRRQSTAKISERAFGRDADANSLKPVMKALAGHKLIDTQEGRGGGCWLTEAGLRRAEKLQKVEDGNG